jgi:hypothetical protein
MLALSLPLERLSTGLSVATTTGAIPNVGPETLIIAGKVTTRTISVAAGITDSRRNYR